METLVTLLFFAIGIAVLVLFLAKYTRRIGDTAITDNFRAAESIAGGQIPARWRNQINLQLKLRKIGIPFPANSSGTGIALIKIQQLYAFFEKSKFFDSEETRSLLLKTLNETRERWRSMAWEEILAESDLAATKHQADR